MEQRSIVARYSGEVLVAVGVLAALYLTSVHSYLLFHSMVEVFTIVVACGVFVIAWNARRYMNNNYLLFLGIASVFVALLDLLHTLAYQGMGVFDDRTANLATQLWIAARYVQAVSWLLAPLVLHRRLKPYVLFGAYILATAILLLAILEWHIFPAAYRQGVGLTTFKRVDEYVISTVFVLAIGLLYLKRRDFDAGVLRYLMLSLAFTVFSEIAFSSYVSVYGNANLIGHLLRVVAVYFLYKAIIETGLEKPYAILLRDLKLTQDELSRHAETLKVQNEELRKTEMQLEEDATVLRTRNEELDSYAHTVAHDLKNPLSVIIAASEVINDVADLTRGQINEFMHQIKTTAFEMHGIIENLLLLSEVRKADAPMEPVDMGQVVTNVRRRLSFMIHGCNARLIVPAQWPIVLGYAPWIEEVWANYISNALKYGVDSPCVELSYEILNDDTIRFCTRDGGPGIPPGDRDRLFVPFSWLSRARRNGHGLGLSIVLHIVEKLGGTVGVESNVGKGSVFYFTLPRRVSEETAFRESASV